MFDGSKYVLKNAATITQFYTPYQTPKGQALGHLNYTPKPNPTV